jgi:hypothetical protein
MSLVRVTSTVIHDHAERGKIMEPRWLIGEDESPEKVTPPQQAEQSTQPERVPEGTYEGKTAGEWLQMASEADRSRQQSYERSDTDGWLSQYASDFMSRKYLLSADLARQDGIWEFEALFTPGGALVPNATYIKTKKGKWVWRIGSGQAVTWFDPSQAKDGSLRRKRDMTKGFLVGAIRTRAVIRTYSVGHGLSGTVGLAIDRKPKSPIEIIDDGRGPLSYPDW